MLNIDEAVQIRELVSRAPINNSMDEARVKVAMFDLLTGIIIDLKAKGADGKSKAGKGSLTP